MKLRTLIVDDEPLARERIKRFLRDETDIEVIGECGNGTDAIAAIKTDAPDLVFLDIQMPENTGFDVVKSLNGRMPAIVFAGVHWVRATVPLMSTFPSSGRGAPCETKTKQEKQTQRAVRMGIVFMDVE